MSVSDVRHRVKNDCCRPRLDFTALPWHTFYLNLKKHTIVVTF
mgnify:CR=1 FL=1